MSDARGFLCKGKHVQIAHVLSTSTGVVDSESRSFASTSFVIKDCAGIRHVPKHSYELVMFRKTLV